MSKTNREFFADEGTQSRQALLSGIPSIQPAKKKGQKISIVGVLILAAALLFVFRGLILP